MKLVNVDGKPVNFERPRDALAAGICMVYQETSLVPTMTAAQNIELGNEKLITSFKKLNIQAQQLLQSLNFHIDPATPMISLRVASAASSASWSVPSTSFPAGSARSAAKAVGLWRAGTGEVRIDVFSTPKPMDEGGRWCVQIGAFLNQESALRLQSELEHEYRTANVIEFQGPTGYWVRIRPANDDRTLAVSIARSLQPAEGQAWLVRLD